MSINPANPQPILIIGGTGTLGLALAKVFSHSGFAVRAVGRQEVDVTNETELRLFIETVQPQAVINAAAHNAVDAIEIDDKVYEEALLMNGKVPGTLAQIASNMNIPIIHISTDYVFAGTEESGYTEDAVPTPISRYGATKLVGEEAVKNAGAREWYVVRISRLFGLRGNSATSKISFVDIMLSKVQKGEVPLRVVNDQFSAPTYAPDAAERILFLLTSNALSGIYHAANAGVCSWYEWAQEIFKQANLSVEIIPIPASEFPRPARAPQFSQLLCTKLPALRSWQDAVAAYVSK